MKTGAFSIIIGFFASFMWLTGADASSKHVVLTQVVLGGAGAGTAAQEYIEFTNQASEPIDITDWCITYSSAASTTNGASLYCFTTKTYEQRIILDAKGVATLATSEFITQWSLLGEGGRFNAGLSGVGGHVRLVNAEGVVVDTLGWGTAVQPEGLAVLSPTDGMALHRKLSEGSYQDTQNNFIDWMVLSFVEPPASGLLEVIDLCLNNDEFPGWQANVPEGYMRDADGVCVPTIETSCLGLQISEILPNPSGADEGKEYVELYNPTPNEIILGDCALLIDAIPQSLTGVVAAGSYWHSGHFSLPNAAGGTITLITTDQEEVVSYPVSMKDDTAWALVNGEWQVTNRPTPGAANVPSLEQAITSASGSSVAALTPCPPGKFRNPETNRCKQNEADVGLTPCGPGQERNPETNRCRKVAASATALLPCAPGQERNPDTNRCRKITTANASLQPCAPGQERNPETNRCRKVSGTVAAASTKEPSASTSLSQHYRVLFIVLAVAAGYGIYEYRHDVVNAWRAVRLKVSGK